MNSSQASRKAQILNDKIEVIDRRYIAKVNVGLMCVCTWIAWWESGASYPIL